MEVIWSSFSFQEAAVADMRYERLFEAQNKGKNGFECVCCELIFNCCASISMNWRAVEIPLSRQHISTAEGS